MRFKLCCHDLTVLRQLFFLGKIFFQRQKTLLTVSLLLGFFAETLAMFMPQLTGNLAGTLGEWNRFRSAAFLFLVIGLVQFLFAVTNDVFDRLLKDRLDRDTTCFTHQQILSLDPACFKENSGGENLTNLGASRGIAYMLLELICFPVFYGGGMVVGLILLFQSLQNIHLPLWLTLLLVCGMAMQPFLTWYFGTLIAKAYTLVRQSSTEINDEILNDFRAPVELRIMNTLKQRFSSMFQLQHKLALRVDKAMLLHIASRYSMSFLILLFQFAVVVSVLCNYDAHNAVVRDLVASILLIPMMFNHLNKLQQMYNNVKDQEPYIEKLFELFQQHSQLPEGKELFCCEKLPTVEFRNVTFGYVPEISVLHDISFKLTGGHCGALISPSGEGKSTIMKLTGRLYMPQKGEISVAGQNIFSVTEESYRKNCITISQFPLFIKGTIRENFRLQAHDASDEEIIDACKNLGLAEMLEIAPEQIPAYELDLGADNLSGGQRKLLALARALLLKPQLLLLDEPSAGLDGPAIQNNLLPFLQNLKKKMTIMVIDHNINFISSVADEIIVLDSGRIAELGCLTELKKNPSSLFTFFLNKWNIQNSKQKNLNIEK